MEALDGFQNLSPISEAERWACEVFGFLRMESASSTDERIFLLGSIYLVRVVHFI